MLFASGSGLKYLGLWNANSNTPSLASGTGNKGSYYVVSVAGITSLDGIAEWGVNDWVVFNGSAWQKIDNSESGVPTPNGIVSLPPVGGYTIKNIYFNASKQIVIIYDETPVS